MTKDTPEDRLLKEIFRGQDLDKHTYNVILKKLCEAGWDNTSTLADMRYAAESGSPVDWIESELSHRVKGLYNDKTKCR